MAWEDVKAVTIQKVIRGFILREQFQHAMEAVYQDQKPEIVKEKEAEAKKEADAAKEAKAAKKIANGEDDSSSEESGSSESDDEKKNKDEHKVQEFWNKALLLMSSP